MEMEYSVPITAVHFGSHAVNVSVFRYGTAGHLKAENERLRAEVEHLRLRLEHLQRSSRPLGMAR